VLEYDLGKIEVQNVAVTPVLVHRHVMNSRRDIRQLLPKCQKC